MKLAIIFSFQWEVVFKRISGRKIITFGSLESEKYSYIAYGFHCFHGLNKIHDLSRKRFSIERDIGVFTLVECPSLWHCPGSKKNIYL